MKRILITAAWLTVTAAGILAVTFTRLAAQPVHPADVLMPAPMREDGEAWGWVLALLLLSTALVGRQIGVLVAWAWQVLVTDPIARHEALLQAQERRDAEDQLLDDCGHQPVRVLEASQP